MQEVTIERKHNEEIDQKIDDFMKKNPKFLEKLQEEDKDYLIRRVCLSKIQVKETKKNSSKESLKDVWMASGLKEDDYAQRIRELPELNDYQRENAAKAGLEAESYRFLQVSQALIGEDSLNRIISELKGFKLEGQKVSSPIRFVIKNVKENIKSLGSKQNAVRVSL